MKGLIASVLIACAIGAAVAATPAPRRATPLAIAFLFDFSISVSNQNTESYPQWALASEGVVQGLRRGDSLRIGVVANRLTLGPWLSEKEIAALFGVAPIVADRDRFGPTPLWDEIDAAVAALAADHRDGRSTILVVTDGRSTGNARSLTQVIDHAKAARVSVSSVVEQTLMLRPNTHAPVDPGDNMQSLASATGGLVEKDDGTSARGGIKSALMRILVQLRASAEGVSTRPER